jgi:hypothetical protein
MKFIVLTVVALVSLAVFAAAVSEACGDKFLVAGQAPMFRHLRGTPYAGVLLLYRNPQSPVATQVLNAKFEKSLKDRGHKVVVVGSAESLEEAVKTKKYDLVVADLNDAKNLTGTPKVLPIVYNASYADVAQLKDTYKFVLEAPSKTSRLLETVNEALQK